MSELFNQLWNIVFTASMGAAGFVAMLVILAFYAGPVLLLVWFFYLRRQYRIEHFGEGSVDGLIVADAYHYAPTHTWITHSKHHAQVGVDDIARRLLTGVVEVRMPAVGTKLEKGQPAATFVCQGGREVTIPSPIEGTVMKVNLELASNPAAFADHPYTEGWLFEVDPVGQAHRLLPTGDAARKWFRLEEQRFSAALEQVFGMQAADGGRLVAPPQELLSEEKWRTLVKSFLA